ncbi:transporter substrate-binding domain-containing protein [Neobacillus sp. PS3-40]|uniref:transporter substrate-binding domain-containing protein n=1 Tax=Neobacillus sp. PS3-40 TaxID=3070679 RepID=UPI0027DEE52F|nr:transporter substrate-binding domain-containing protein [Neobacillus sp. PS3-40]WML44048.1 transporter substrate-binding domain-containing protein [Neobacillus sp. PS3-40]
MFKRFSIMLLIAVVALVSVACSNNSSDKEATKKVDTAWTKIKDKGTLVVATSGTLYPTSYHDSKTNKLTGYEVEVVNELAKRLGLKVKYSEIGFDGMLTSINSGQVDLAANDIEVNDARKDKFAFSTPVKYSFGTAIVRKSDLSGIKTLEDIKGKKSAGAATSVYMDLSRKLGAKEVVYDNATNEQYLRDVATGRTDVILNDYYLQTLALAYYPKLNITIHPNIRFNPTSVALVMKKGNTDLVKNVNKELNEMLTDGTMTKISKEFFANADVTKQVKQKNIQIISTK